MKQSNAAYKHYKFRAECYTDVVRFFGQFQNGNVSYQVEQTLGRPDITVTFRANTSLAVLVAAAREVVDCHVIAETLNTRAAYTGERRQ